MQKHTVLVAMSGGVDSSVTAYLMQQAGYSCMGATMQLYPNACTNPKNRHSCCSWRDIDDAAEIAVRLGIPFELVDFTAEFRAQVIEKFIASYEAGCTPNPCIDCNCFMKFDLLLRYANAHGCDSLATGHYARIERRSDGRLLLRRAADAAKDQSYVLYMLKQEQLARLHLPLGQLHKTEVRRIAEEQGFVNAHKHDSQDICFVPGGDYAAFIEKTTGKRSLPGDFVAPDGTRLGTHNGAIRYTVGQRKGLGLALGHPVYVCGKDMANNTVTVGPESALYTRRLLAADLNWIAFDTPPAALRVMACTRYHAAPQPATAEMQSDGTLLLTFDAPQRAVTPGQAVVFYDGDIVLGGGTIFRAF